MSFFAQEHKISDKSERLTIISYHGNRDLLIPDLLEILKDKKYSCLYEPFSGSAAISFAAMKSNIASSYVINESYDIFECLWKFVRNYPQDLISNYSDLVRQYTMAPKHQRAGIYNNLLGEFNQQYKLGLMLNALILFLFLMNFSENHVPYFDEQLKMTSRPNIFVNGQAEQINSEFAKKTKYLSELLSRNQTLFTSGDFEASLKSVEPGDLVVMDPPYPRQAENVYYKPHKEKALQTKIRGTLEQLSNRKIDFMIFYGWGILKLEDQFDENQYKVHHLVRLTKHLDYGYFLDHIYVSATINLTPENLPSTMAFYRSFCAQDEELTQEKYQKIVGCLYERVHMKNEQRLDFVAKL